MLLNAAKSQGYSFYRFSVIKGKPIGRGGGVKLTIPSYTHTHTHTEIRVKAAPIF